MDIVELKKLEHPVTKAVKYIAAVRLKADLNTEEQFNKINAILIDYYKESKDFTIVYYGNLDKFIHYDKVVAKFKKRDHNHKRYYRNYCTSEEQQIKTMSYVNVAEDAITSFNTVMSALGSKIGAIIEVLI